MKASRFVKPFEEAVDRWERDLSHIMEVVEMLLTVQRQWMYLENIFLGEDIRKQLPKESAEFDNINVLWKQIMTATNKTRNARDSTKKEGLLESLNTMNAKLEDIQKSLDMYLETKRQIFPRFYFISNDDLLEILGQSKNPEAVQPHLKKCFDNINLLKIEKVTSIRSLNLIPATIFNSFKLLTMFSVILYVQYHQNYEKEKKIINDKIINSFL